MVPGQTAPGWAGHQRGDKALSSGASGNCGEDTCHNHHMESKRVGRSLQCFLSWVNAHILILTDAPIALTHAWGIRTLFAQTTHAQPPPHSPQLLEGGGAAFHSPGASGTSRRRATYILSTLVPRRAVTGLACCVMSGGWPAQDESWGRDRTGFSAKATLT